MRPNRRRALPPRQALRQRRQSRRALTGTLSYWHTFTSQSEMDGLDKVTKAFKDKYPNITVKSENVPNSDFMAKFTLAVQGGGKPETTMVSSVRLPDMVTMGGLKDMTARVATWDQRQYLPDERFKDATVDGKIYGVPSFAFVDWMYYRADWFKEAGCSRPRRSTTFRMRRSSSPTRPRTASASACAAPAVAKVW